MNIIFEVVIFLIITDKEKKMIKLIRANSRLIFNKADSQFRLPNCHLFFPSKNQNDVYYDKNGSNYKNYHDEG